MRWITSNHDDLFYEKSISIVYAAINSQLVIILYWQSQIEITSGDNKNNNEMYDVSVACFYRAYQCKLRTQLLLFASTSLTSLYLDDKSVLICK